MKIIITYALLLLTAVSCGNSLSKQTAQSPYGGVYTFGDKTGEAPHGEAYIHPENDSMLLFYIYVNNGAPSYNNGSIDGQITIREGKGVFRKRFEFSDKDCVLDFSFHADTLTVKEVGRDCDCGFGHGVYLDDDFLRTDAEIPEYYTTIANDTVYFDRWQELSISSSQSRFPKIDRRFTAFFPDMTLGRIAERGVTIPTEIIRNYLPDLLDSEDGSELEVSFYAVGKITDYMGRDLFICDFDYDRPDEEAYDNHTDGIRQLLLFDREGSPVLFEDEYGIQRLIIELGYHYYGEGGETNLDSYFDTDTTLLTTLHRSESESATGYPTPFVVDMQYRRRITPSDGAEVQEVSRLEFSSPYYDRNWLREQKQSWSRAADLGIRMYPTVDSQWPLYDPASESEWLELSFYIDLMDGEFVPIFEIRGAEGNIANRYLVGCDDNVILPSSEPLTPPAALKCSVIIKTSDGDLELLPAQRCLRVRSIRL